MKARIRHTSKIVDVIPHGHGFDYKENKPGTDYECFMARDLDFEGVEENRPATIASGSRQLKDITDAELKRIIEISGCYGAKEYWSEIKITRIDRDRYRGEIVIDFEQSSLTGKYGIAKRRFFFDYAHLRYFVSMDEPFTRLSTNHSVCESTQMLLWLIAQDFDILECLSYAKIEPTGGMSANSIGIIAGIGDCIDFDPTNARFFSWDDEREAFEYQKNDHSGNTRLYSLVEIKEEKNNKEAYKAK